MKKILYGAVLVLMFILTRCSRDGVNRRDIEGAEKIMDIEFSRNEQDTLMDYLLENRQGYDSMRKFHLDYSTAPVLYFDPRPDGFTSKRRSEENNWRFSEPGHLPGSDEEISFLTVAELSAFIRSRQLTSVRLTRIYLDRLKRFDDSLHAVVTITEDLALKQAALADEEISHGRYRGPLHGIPYGLKDLFSVPGYKTTWGAEPYREQVLEEKAAVVKKLEEAGAILVAKLTSGALARGDVWFGGMTRNPWDLKQGASGSSAGSASATSAGLVAFSIGTETLGSILSPSGRCGVTGLRPTYGSVSRAGAMSLAWSMDKVGPICRSAQDCAIVFKVIKGSEQPPVRDRTVVDYPFAFNPPADLKGYKVGYFRKMFEKDTARSKANNEQSLKLLRDLGADLHEVSMPDSIPFSGFDIILRAEAGSFFDELVREHRDRLLSEQDQGSRANSLRQSRFISAVEYLQANRHRKVLIEKFNVMIRDYDFIVAPSAGERLSMATNLTGHPAISIPTGLDKKGHPTSIILIGNLYDEGPILEAAYLVQQASGFDEKHPALFLSKK